MSQPNVVIRPARAEDIPEVVNKIRELAIFEKMEDQCKMTPETLLKDGGFLSDKDHKYYELLVAEVTEDSKPKMVGYAMWFYAWTSWEGECPFKCFRKVSSRKFLEEKFPNEKFIQFSLGSNGFRLLKEKLASLKTSTWMKTIERWVLPEGFSTWSPRRWSRIMAHG